MPDLTETEIKLYTPELAVIQHKLQSAGATLSIPRVFERNVRYENAAKDLTSRGIVVRLRQDNRALFTYKEPPETITTEELSHRFEAEVEISDFATMEVILGKLGYAPHLVYEKYRTTYHLDSLEIVLDEMPYGNFTEIEGTPDAIFATIDSLDLGGYTRYKTNYIQLFENVRRHLRLNFTDLTFENFAGVDVPQRAFDSPVIE